LGSCTTPTPAIALVRSTIMSSVTQPRLVGDLGLGPVDSLQLPDVIALRRIE